MFFGVSVEKFSIYGICIRFIKVVIIIIENEREMLSRKDEITQSFDKKIFNQEKN